MYTEFYDYIQKLHLFIESQEMRIKRLENLFEEALKEIKDLKAKPSISVDKIEYKFDQLKVEKLDGTLNIGLNPSDLQGIEDFAVGNQSVTTPFTPAQKMRNVMEVEEEILNYVDTEADQLISSCEQNFEKQLDPSYYSFIKEDIKKQLPERIEYYWRNIPIQKHLPENEQENKHKICQQLKTDIEKGIVAFVQNLPDARKE